MWRLDLDAADAEVERLARTLSDDEQARAARFAFPRDRRRFVVARGGLREILGRHLCVEPAALGLALTREGKPVLAGPAGAAALRFSVSHAGSLAVYALTLGLDVGVDVERLERGPAAELLASRALSARESAALEALPPDERERAFFTVWTRKEAYAKARGLGLALSFQGFSVSADARHPALLEAEDDDPARWTLADLDVGADYAAAVAVAGAGARVTRGRWAIGPAALSAR